MLQPRTGNRSTHNAPRNVYRTADGDWVAVSVERDEHRRAGHAAGRPARSGRRSRGSRPAADAPSTPTRSTPPVGGVDRRATARRGAGGVRRRPRRPSRRCTTPPTSSPTRSSRATGAIATVDDAELGPIVMTGPDPRLSATPGAIRWTGRRARRRHRCRARRARVSSADELDAPARPGRGRMTAPPLTWLYAPASRPELVEKALASRAPRRDRRPRGRRRGGGQGGGARPPRRRCSARRSSAPSACASTASRLPGGTPTRWRRRARRASTRCSCRRSSRPEDVAAVVERSRGPAARSSCAA